MEISFACCKERSSKSHNTSSSISITQGTPYQMGMIPAACLDCTFSSFPRPSSISTTSSSSSPLISQVPGYGLIPSFLNTPFSLTPIKTPHLVSFRKYNAPVCSLDQGAASGSTMDVAEVDQYSAVKKKAEDIASELRGTSIYLVGINSKVKTSLGKFIAETLRYYFFDSDKLIEEAAGGAAAAKSFRERDEKGFNDSETEVLKQLSSMGRLVVSAGNGAFKSPTNLSLLRHGILIWIDIPLDMIAKEAVDDGLQFSAVELSPSVSYPEVLDQLSALYRQMQGAYATADATISLQQLAQQLGYDALDAVTVEAMALEVLKEIGKLMRVKKLMEEAARPF